MVSIVPSPFAMFFLELIPELAINLNQFTSDNNRASKINQSKIVLSLLFKVNKQLAEAVKKEQVSSTTQCVAFTNSSMGNDEVIQSFFQ
jgi:hypothetical protein